MKFPLDKTNGLNFDQYNSIVSYIRDLKPAKYEVVVGHQKRTNPQNRRYWKAIVVCFEEWTGYTKNEVHDLLKKKFLSYKKKGKDGKVREFTKSTTKLTTKEFAEYCKECELLAIENGFEFKEDPELEAYLLKLGIK